MEALVRLMSVRMSFFWARRTLGVFIGVHEGSDAFVGEHLGKEGFIHGAVDHMDARNPPRRRRRHDVPWIPSRDASPRGFREGLELGHEDLPEKSALMPQAVGGREVEELDGLELRRQGEGDRVGVDAVGLAVAVEAQRRDDRNDALGEQSLKHLGVDALDLARELVVDAADDEQCVCLSILLVQFILLFPNEKE
jgi:hypothetical protein